MKKYKKLIADNIQKFRKKAGYTQESLADQLGVDPRTMRGWENGRTFPKLENLLKLSLILKIELKNIFE